MRSLAYSLPVVLFAAAACGDDTTAGSGSGGGGAGSGGQGGTPTECDYPTPATGQGIAVDEVLPAALRWDGFAPEEDAAREIGIAELHDCDGTHGIHALLLSTLNPGATADESHVTAIREHFDDWHARGIVVAFLLLEDEGGGAATVEGAELWRNDTLVRDMYVFSDPDFLLVSGGMVDTPQNHIVDPRTMRVVAIAEGHPFDVAPLEALADQNEP
jgi:hypothetical protein